MTKTIASGLGILLAGWLAGCAPGTTRTNGADSPKRVLCVLPYGFLGPQAMWYEEFGYTSEASDVVAKEDARDDWIVVYDGYDAADIRAMFNNHDDPKGNYRTVRLRAFLKMLDHRIAFLREMACDEELKELEWPKAHLRRLEQLKMRLTR